MIFNGLYLPFIYIFFIISFNLFRRNWISKSLITSPSLFSYRWQESIEIQFFILFHHAGMLLSKFPFVSKIKYKKLKAEQGMCHKMYFFSFPACPVGRREKYPFEWDDVSTNLEWLIEGHTLCQAWKKKCEQDTVLALTFLLSAVKDRLANREYFQQCSTPRRDTSWELNRDTNPVLRQSETSQESNQPGWNLALTRLGWFKMYPQTFWHLL